MTGAIILALIALVGLMMFSVTIIILIIVVSRTTPAWFSFKTGYGHFEIGFDTKVDRQRYITCQG